MAAVGVTFKVRVSRATDMATMCQSSAPDTDVDRAAAASRWHSYGRRDVSLVRPARFSFRSPSPCTALTTSLTKAKRMAAVPAAQPTRASANRSCGQSTIWGPQP